MLRILAAVLVFGLDLYALAALWGTRPRPRRPLAWTAVVVLVPVIGAVWLLRTRRRPVPERWHR